MKYTGTVELHSIEGRVSHFSVERGPPSAAEQVMDILGQKKRVLLGGPLDALSRAVDILRSPNAASGLGIGQQETATSDLGWREWTPLDIPLANLPSAMRYLSDQYLSGAQTWLRQAQEAEPDPDFSILAGLEISRIDLPSINLHHLHRNGFEGELAHGRVAKQ